MGSIIFWISKYYFYHKTIAINIGINDKFIRYLATGAY